VKSVKPYVFMGLMIALEIVMTRFIQIPVTILPGFEDKVSLGFLPVAMSGALFGVGGGTAVAALGDFIRAIILPQGGAINPLFTLNAAIRGAIYGAVLKKETSIPRIFVANILILLVNIFILGSFISISYGTPLPAVIATRIPTSVTNFAVQTLVLIFVGRPIVRKLDYVRK